VNRRIPCGALTAIVVALVVALGVAFE